MLFYLAISISETSTGSLATVRPPLKSASWTASKITSWFSVSTPPQEGKISLILSSSVTKCKVLGNFGTSDHNIILTELSCPLPRINYAPRKIYPYSKGDYSAVNEEIETIDWDSNMTSGDIEENWLFFNHQYQILLDKHVPFKFVKPGRRHVPPWTRYKSVTKAKANGEPVKSRPEKVNLRQTKLYMKPIKNQSKTPWNLPRLITKKSCLIKWEKNLKRFWNYTRHFSRSSQTVDTLESGTSQVTIDSEKAEILNEHFAESQTAED